MDNDMLYRHALDAANRGPGIILVIQPVSNASLIELARAVQDAGRGSVYVVDAAEGVDSPEDDATTTDEPAIPEAYTKLLCHVDGLGSGEGQWSDGIDLLVMDGRHSYDDLALALRETLPLVRNGGTVFLNDRGTGEDLAAAVRDRVPFSRFQTTEYSDTTLVLRCLPEPRTLVLCGGMQSSGSSLVSMCFLQRDDMDGVYDIDNSLVHQDFSRVTTDMVWAKMTSGSFSLRELVELYTAQGWQVRSMLVYRDPEETLASLITKPYGLDGCNGDDPPLYIRLSRYMADVEAARLEKWPIIDYAKLVKDPEKELRRACDALELEWDDNMMSWPKPLDSFAYSRLGSPTLHDTLAPGAGIKETIARYTGSDGEPAAKQTAASLAAIIVGHYRRLESGHGVTDTLPLHPCVYKDTYRDRITSELQQMYAHIGRLNERIERQDERIENLHRYIAMLQHYIDRLVNHAVIGRVYRLWIKWVNPALKKPD